MGALGVVEERLHRSDVRPRVEVPGCTHPHPQATAGERLTDAEVRERTLEKAAEALIPHRAKAIETLVAMLDSKDPAVLGVAEL